MVMLMSNISVIILLVALITALSVLITIQYFNVRSEVQTFKVQNLALSYKIKNRLDEDGHFVIIFASLWVLMGFAVLPRVINYLW